MLNKPLQALRLGAINFAEFDWKWPGTESNRRHEDFQSSALPTELPGRVGKTGYFEVSLVMGLLC